VRNLEKSLTASADWGHAKRKRVLILMNLYVRNYSKIHSSDSQRLIAFLNLFFELNRNIRKESDDKVERRGSK
jgi:hypothetical protein